MTQFDKTLIQKAETFRRSRYQDIDVLISIADTTEAKRRLADHQQLLYDLMQETI